MAAKHMFRDSSNICQDLVSRLSNIGSSREGQICMNLMTHFDIHQVPADGDCFYHCVAQHTAAAGPSAIRNLVTSYASQNWDSLQEARHFYKDLDSYIAEVNKKGSWGGSTEAEVLNQAYGMPIVIWLTNDFVWSQGVRLWERKSDLWPELHLALNGSHFQRLTPKGFCQPAPKETLPMLHDLEIVSNTDTGTIENLEDIFLPEHEKQRLELFSKPRITVTPQPLISKQLQSLLEQEKTLPMRVGRLLSKVFPCNVRAVQHEFGCFMLVPEVSSHRNTISLNELGAAWMRTKRKGRGLKKPPTLVLSDDLLVHADSQFVLTTLVGEKLLASNASLLPREITHRLATTASIVILSSFLYKSSMKAKREFILCGLASAGIATHKLKKYVNSLRPFSVYQRPLEVAQKVCELSMGSYLTEISLSVSRLPATSYLLLSCLDISEYSLNEFESVLTVLKEDELEDPLVSSREVYDIKTACSRLEHVFELKRRSAHKMQYRDYLAAEGLKPDSFIHGPGNLYIKSKEAILKDFFTSRNIMKLVSRHGKATSGTSITSLIAYISNLVVSRERLSLSQEDVGTLETLERRLIAIQSRDARIPIPLICSLVETNVAELQRILPPDCAQECAMLFENIRNSDTHSSAWSAALRLKGVAYEGLFAKTHKIKYIPEDQKPNLSMAVQTYFPELFEKFLLRTHLHPEVREFKPDFLIAKKRLMPDPSITKVGLKQVFIPLENDDPESALAIKRRKKAFPLPEVAIAEIDTFESIIPRIKEVTSRRRSIYNQVSGDFLESVPKVMEPQDEQGKGSDGSSAGDLIPAGCSSIFGESPDGSEEKTEFLIIEVGYQTDTEAKVQTDIGKWKIAVSLLKDLGIASTVIACSDCTSTKQTDWYIEEEYVRTIKNSVSNLFSRLSQNSPQEVTDMMVGAISTQKIRAVLKSGSTIRTPVTLQDVLTAWNENKSYIMHRPTDENIPNHLCNIMRLSLCEGAVISKESAHKLIAEVISQQELIADWVEQTKYACEVLEPLKSSEKVLIGWLMTDVAGCRCDTCYGKIKASLKKTVSYSEILAFLASQVQLASHCDGCHLSPVEKKKFDLVTRRSVALQHVVHMDTELFDQETKTTTLDRLCRLTLPGKTEKERSVKRAVEALRRQAMRDSNIPCIKLPTGQILVNSALFQHHKPIRQRQPTKPQPVEGKSTEDSAEETRLDKLRRNLSPDKLRGYSEVVKATIKDLLDSTDRQKGSLCEFKEEWARRVFSDLEADISEEELLSRIENSRIGKQGFTVNNDKLYPFCDEEVRQYINDKVDSLLNQRRSKMPFKLDCVIHKELFLECTRRYFSTPYYDCAETVAKLCKLLLKFQWFQEMTLYGKICETFLQCCTEFNRSGIKVRKVRHTNLNLAVALPSNKKENMKCCLYDNYFIPVGHGRFMMSRRVAVLGAAIPYIIIICFVQCLQHSRCIDVLHSANGGMVDAVIRRNAGILERLIPCLCLVNSGHLEKAATDYVEFCKESGNYLNRSSYDIFVTTTAGLSVMFHILLGPAMLLNSQPFNKQIQNMRFGMLYGVSRIACPKELGVKLASSCRHVETYVARLYLQLTTFCCGLDPPKNIETWKQHDLCPNITIPSLSIPGNIISGDRQLIFDIYLVHIYNKEMDNFDEGCIKVLQETLERHVSWEMQLMESIKSYAAGKSGQRLKETRTMRLLLGLPNLKQGLEDWEAPDREGSSSHSSTSSHSIGKTRSFSSGKKFKSAYGRLRSRLNPIATHLGLEVVPDEQKDFQFAAQDRGTGIKYDGSVESVMKDMKQIIKENPSHTYGCFELVQAMTEVAKKKFPPEAIGKAQRDTTNWQGVSAYTETTSSVSEPKRTIVLKDALKVLSTGEVKKTVKLVRNRLKKLDGASDPRPERVNELVEMISTVETFSVKEREEIRRGLLSPGKLIYFPWRSIISRSLRDVLISNDANMIYCWLKSLASGIKKNLRKYMPALKYSKQSTPRDHPKLKKLLTDLEYESLVDLIEIFKCLVKGNTDYDMRFPRVDELYSAWIRLLLEVPFMQDIVTVGQQSLNRCLAPFGVLSDAYIKLCSIKKEYPDLSFTNEEIEVKALESAFLKEFDSEVMQVINLIFALSLCCPWAVHYKSFELLLSQESNPLSDESTDSEHLVFLKELGPCALMQGSLWKAFGLQPLNPEDAEKLEMLYRYCCALFISNSEPIRSVVGLQDVVVASNVEESALSTTRALLSKYGLESTDLDFKWTLNLIANSNFEVAKRLTGRSEGERLPRSVRSKVIYEMIKLVKNTGMAILQQHAFSYILNSGHRFFAVLAPKAQLGGHRDLLVQEIMTKIIHAATETFSRALLSTTNDDGLTNQHLKESILESARDKLQLAKLNNGKPLGEGPVVMRFFIVTFCVSGDRTKWGPIHCTAFFSAMMQQLLQDVPDWNAFFKLVMLKNLYRQVEIPAGAIKKILNAFRLRFRGPRDISSLSEDELRKELANHVDIWEGNPFLQFIVTVYLSRGKMALECYNHMGQGIHHATSSVMTSCMAVLAEEMITAYFLVHMPELSVSVQHAGSSDDYAKVVTVSGYLPNSLFERYSETIWSHIARLQNAMIGTARACQMKDSAKTLIGDFVCEFYSEFLMFHRVTPAVIKFILTGLINSSVTSPQSMVQACQVSAQQAMYNSVPLLTNFCAIVLRQQIFANHTELFQRKYGPIVHGLPSAFGRLYLPMFSNLTSSAIAIEDAESIAADMDSALDLCSRLRATPEVDFSHLQLPSPEVSEGASAVDTVTGPESADGTASVSSGSTSSFRFGEIRKFTSTEKEYLKMTTQATIDEVEKEVFECVNSIYNGESDYEGWPCIEKIMASPLVLDNAELKEIGEANPLKLVRFVRSVVCCIIIGFYRSFASEGTEKTLKANLNRDENRIVEDPMIQLLPEKLRRELARLGMAKDEYNEYVKKSYSMSTLAEQVARRVITLNCLTEDYEAEADRLKQTLGSRNIIYGLASGIKELSLPLYTIFLKSYFYIDKIFMDHQDRWNTKHSRNYRDSTGRPLDGKVVTKYMTWLDAVLCCLLTRSNEKAAEPHSLFNPSLKCVELIPYEDKTKVLSLKVEELRLVKEELQALAIQFSDSNRLKLKILEASRPVSELEANKVVISKSGLFSAGEQVKIRNNPALVIGFYLSKETVLEVKPSKMDLSALIIDAVKLEQFYTSISEVCAGIVAESKRLEKQEERPKEDDVASHANTLTLLSRLAQKSNTKIVSFHMIKPISMHTESTVTDLISFGTKEGRQLVLADPGVETGTTSLKYWRILHCMGAIGNLNLADRYKTDLLVGFMNWVPKQPPVAYSCSMRKYEQTVLEQFKDRSIVSNLYEELPNIKKEVERKQIESLVDYIKDPMVLVSKKPFFGKTVDFNVRNSDSARSGNFTLCSSAGEAVGMFVAGTLHVFLSKDNDFLLNEVEVHVLQWQNKIRTDVLTKEQHDYFIDLLPHSNSLSKRMSEGMMKAVSIDPSNPRMLKLGISVGNNRVVRVRPHILTVRKTSEDAKLNEPRLVWGKSSLSIVYDEFVNEATYHESILSLRKKLDCAVESEVSAKAPLRMFSDLKVVLGRIHFKYDATTTSLSLLHYYLAHAAQTAHLEFHSKSAILSQVLGQEKKELSILKQLRKSNIPRGALVRDSTDHLLSVANKVEGILNDDDVPLYCLPEIQHFLDETGNSAISVDAFPKGYHQTYKWKCSVDTISVSKPASDLRTVVSILGTESLPLQFAQLIANADLWHMLHQIGKRAQQQFVACTLSDDVPECLFCSTLYVYQSKKKEREDFSYPAGSLLGLVRKREFEINENEDTVSFHPTDDGEVELIAVLKFPLSGRADSESLKTMWIRAMALHSSIFESCKTLPEIKEKAFVNLECLSTHYKLTIRYGSGCTSETTVDKVFCGATSTKPETMRGLRDVANLASFLMGREHPFPFESVEEEKETPCIEGVITLDDLMSLDFTLDKKQCLTDSDTGYRFDFNDSDEDAQ
uniref:RNA-directed RNA polymerase L n=1 Tax=Yushu Nairo tick virus 1 TaxID=2972220 RepID=A0A9E7V1W7_9VIRU|nr:MAG: RNA-dependent RNA-polymerase [Yushu Nairo tick virus 1]